MKHFSKILCVAFLLAALFPRGIYAECKVLSEPPKTPPSADELRFVAVGDTGRGGCPEEGSIQCAVRDAMLELWKSTRFSMLVFLGDNVYKNGHPKDFKKKWYDPYRPLHDNGVLFRGVIGNHDTHDDDGAILQMKFLTAKDVSAQEKYFTTPYKDQLNFPEKITETYYTFPEQPGMAEFFALDSPLISGGYGSGKNYPINTDTAEIDWLAKKLKNSKAKWRIVLMHHIFYSSSDGHGVFNSNQGGSDIREMKKLWRIVPDLNDNGVQLVLSGHDHFFERIDAGKVNLFEKMQLPVGKFAYFVNGGGAEPETKVFRDLKQPPAFSACGKEVIGSFMLFSVKPDKISYWAIGQDGRTFDSGTIQ